MAILKAKTQISNYISAMCYHYIFLILLLLMRIMDTSIKFCIFKYFLKYYHCLNYPLFCELNLSVLFIFLLVSYLLKIYCAREIFKEEPIKEGKY